MGTTKNAGSEQRVMMGNRSWPIYLALAKSVENPRGRLAYDQGVLEVMSPTMRHESIARLIGRMIETWSLEMNIEIVSAKSTTLLRPDLEKGVEADECYYVGSADPVRGRDDIDLTIHPPPDLAIEVDISRSSRIKLPIYAAIGVGPNTARPRQKFGRK